MSEMYYWLETAYNGEKAWALHCKLGDEDDRVILTGSYEKFEEGLENIDHNSHEYLTRLWGRLDEHITDMLGFLPPYDVN